MRSFGGVLAVLAHIPLVLSQKSLPSTFPHNYPGQPSGDFSPAWQNYFEVNNTQLTNVSFPLGRSFAGNIGVGRDGHPNNTLFFWAFENSQGSLTNTSSTEPWGIWLNGGPGSSSMLGLLFENGPIRFGDDLSLSAHNQSWDKVADYIWIDQPVGVGFATADSKGYISDEDQMGEDFLGFLTNLVKVFPSLATRPLHLTGESYAGTYIPYILKAYFQAAKPPVKIAKIAIGDGTVGSQVVSTFVPVLSIIETYPQFIAYDQEVFNYFKEQNDLCGFNLTLTYPQNGTFPTINLLLPARLNQSSALDVVERRKSSLTKFSQKFEAQTLVSDVSKREFELERRAELVKRSLTGRANGTLDSWYACDLFDEMIDYALNFTFPWNISNPNSFNVYDIPNSAVDAPVTPEASGWLNDPHTRAAIHAPTSKDWTDDINFVFGGMNSNNNPGPEPMVFLNELAANATAQGVGIVLYSGNDDSLVAHFGTEVVIQNTTFGGIQGFTRKPSTPWTDDSGKVSGIVHQERNWTFVLFDGASHLVPAKVPNAALTFLREFVFGTNTTGMVISSGGNVSVTGGEDGPLIGDIIQGSDEIFYGKEGATSTFTFPSATTEAWNNFIHSAVGTPATSGSTGNNGSSNNSGQGLEKNVIGLVMAVLITSAWMSA
ncbi:Alpha/Beta hydrolase protein [Crucibulum laeve]|uniref:Carboxypeptidase n=1 Tax=Crucibulum laeve TaxID=68775 RepID=A0A5C3LGJ9_9AGAR|nr:Alpha/Beta hydrolase protein [Crucibulum laeve]